MDIGILNDQIVKEAFGYPTEISVMKYPKIKEDNNMMEITPYVNGLGSNM